LFSTDGELSGTSTSGAAPKEAGPETRGKSREAGLFHDHDKYPVELLLIYPQVS